MGSISAAYMISQFGPIPIVNKDIRTEAEKILQENLLKNNKQGDENEQD